MHMTFNWILFTFLSNFPKVSIYRDNIQMYRPCSLQLALISFVENIKNWMVLNDFIHSYQSR